LRSSRFCWTSRECRRTLTDTDAIYGAYASGEISDKHPQSTQIFRTPGVFSIEYRLHQRRANDDQISETCHLPRLHAVGYT
jgi:hypothetical protein